MRFTKPLLEGRLIRRYQRFLADVDTPAGPVTAHCPNTGSMLGCAAPGLRVWLSPAANPARKLAWTWELVEVPGDTAPVRVGVHTGRSNGLVREAIEAGRVPALAGYPTIRGEVKYGEGSRIDLLLSGDGRPDCYVEVKNVTAAVSGGIGYFPDAVTTRGAKHLREMAAMVAVGRRAVLVFCVQRADVAAVRPADHIDPAYGRALREALAAGVEVLALGARVSPEEIVVDRALPVTVPA
ncbi:MAG TPA: DNA/RNA nuclease SfsA [Zoogloea sp.]|uniref:DNA/RNA nuclease SfsA n=1 Tax=Zoogloea sp. TaxID=49181 RepID=UPI002C69047E|nr:DNA/RNA nuclease SfsA [Zoogloea sp.]HMY50964.1 DNA/RNA nuclease SfsA [Rhodocyclaceae bacterium]HNC79479.1 DNA/RNA nuclease SfsA [Rhodocyclaceae bacterium]HNI47957.1 DNA/RNA nuclease SfsA [Zoogloea sp.]